MAQDFTQKYGIYCEETFAPITQLTCTYSLLVITAICHQFLFQMDVKNAFLNFNANVIEAIYMQPPSSLEHPLHIVYCLQKALYGLKEAPQAWFTKFNTTISHLASPPILMTLSSFFISQNKVSCFYMSRDSKHLHIHCFELQYLGTHSYFFSFEVTSSNDTYDLFQAKCARSSLMWVSLVIKAF